MQDPHRLSLQCVDPCQDFYYNAELSNKQPPHACRKWRTARAMLACEKLFEVSVMRPPPMMSAGNSHGAENTYDKHADIRRMALVRGPLVAFTTSPLPATATSATPTVPRPAHQRNVCRALAHELLYCGCTIHGSGISELRMFRSRSCTCSIERISHKTSIVSHR